MATNTKYNEKGTGNVYSFILKYVSNVLLYYFTNPVIVNVASNEKEPVWSELKFSIFNLTMSFDHYFLNLYRNMSQVMSRGKPKAIRSNHSCECLVESQKL